MSSRAKRTTKADEEKKKEAPFDLKWTSVTDTFLVLDSPKIAGSSKIAAFDMDSTLVEPKSGAKFPNSRSDWKWWHDSVPEKLKKLNEEGFKVIIYTNQGGIEKGKQKQGDITGKIMDLCEELGFPFQAYIAAAEDNYRKPHTTMWDYMVEHRNGGIKPDLTVSYYCGDAAGRQAGWKDKKKKDFSVGDRQFGANIGCLFYTPEELFLEEKAVPFQWGAIDPATILSLYKDRTFDFKSLPAKSQEMIILVGRPASGKSTITKTYLEPAGYVRVNMDTLKSDAKCKKTAKESLAEGLSVAVDNTNAAASKRADYIKMAQDAGVPVRAIYVNTDQEISSHLNYVRVRETDGAVRRIPDVAYRTFNKNFSEPKTSEGFDEVIKIDFIPDLRGDEKFKKQFLQWTPEGI